MTRRTPSIVIIAGEASGDLHGANLAARLRQMIPDADIRGIGGCRMREAGVKLLFDSSSWSAIGITEALKVVPRLAAALLKLRKNLIAHPPDVLVLIDFGVFNIRVGRRLRPSGTKVLYYFPPGSWCRGATYSRLRGAADRVVTQFPWSAEVLKEQGFHADFFGHPLLDVVKPCLPKEEFYGRFGLNPDRPLVGLLPGSRRQELVHCLPAMLLAAARLCESMPELQFALPLAQSVSGDAVARELSRVPWLDVTSCADGHDSRSSIGRATNLPIASRTSALAREEGSAEPRSGVIINLLPGMAYDVLANSRAAVVASGTATVEAAILGCPMVIIYRGSGLTALEYSIRGKRIRFIGMPNIIADRSVCPELIQEAASPVCISELASGLISDSPERAEMLRDLAEVRALLGDPGAVEKTAQVVCDLLKTSF